MQSGDRLVMSWGSVLAGDLDGTAVWVFGHDPAASGHLLVPGQHRCSGPCQALSYLV
jgi:hypothetical protein